MKNVIKCAKLIEAAGLVETENPRKANSIIFFRKQRLFGNTGFIINISEGFNKKIVCTSRALARKLKLLTFSRNWEFRLVFTKRRHHGWRQKTFFGTTHRMLENAILGKKYFRAWLYRAHTNHHWEMFFFSLFIVNLVRIWNRNK